MSDLGDDPRVRELWDEILAIVKGEGAHISLTLGTSLMLTSLGAHVTSGDAEGLRLAKLHASIVGPILTRAAAAQSASDYIKIINDGIEFQRDVAGSGGRLM